MLPGMNRLPKDITIDDNALVHVEAIIQSMTREERQKPQIINGQRRKRIATGSGTSVQEVNRVLKQFTEMQKMVRTFSKGKIPQILRGMRPN